MSYPVTYDLAKTSWYRLRRVRGHDAAVAAIFVAATAGVSTFDPRIARVFEDTSLSHVRAGQRLDKAFTHINETTLTIGTLVTYGIARLAKSQTAADVAFHASEAVVSASSALASSSAGFSNPRSA